MISSEISLRNLAGKASGPVDLAWLNKLWDKTKK